MNDLSRQLFQAVSDKNMKVIGIILATKPLPTDLFSYSNNSGMNTLMMAVQLVPEEDAHKFTALLLGLKESPVPIDVVNKVGQTALMIAAKKGYGLVVKALLDSKANYDIRTPVSITFIIGNWTLTRIL